MARRFEELGRADHGFLQRDAAWRTADEAARAAVRIAPQLDALYEGFGKRVRPAAQAIVTRITSSGQSFHPKKTNI